MDAAKVLLAMFDSESTIPDDKAGSVNVDEYVVGKLFPCDLREMWDLVSEQAQQRGHCIRQGKGSELRDIPGGNKLLLECTRAGFTHKQLLEFKAAEGAEIDDDFEHEKKRKFTKNSLRKKRAVESATGNRDELNLNSAKRQQRASSSFRCGCGWRLKLAFRPKMKCTEVLQAKLLHTNGCVPSKENLRFLQKRRGSNIARIPRFLIVMLDVLFKGKSQPCEIRDLILPNQQSITPQALINIKLAVA